MEKDFQTKLMQLEYLNQQIRGMQMHLNEVTKAVDELSILKVGLKNLKTSKDGDSLLVPLGASSYVKANLAEQGKVIVSVGAGVFVEKTIVDAVPIVTKQIEELKKQEETVFQNITMLSQESERLSFELNSTMRAGQGV